VISNQVGKAMMDNMMKYMRAVEFNMDARAWCYKHHDWCRIHGPEEGHDRSATRMAIAGTTCTSWSSVGKCLRWCASSVVPFMVWAFETAAWAPHIVIHECAPRFDVAVLQAIFIAYVVTTLVFSPTDLGYPASRPRRWTVLIHRSRVAAVEPSTKTLNATIDSHAHIARALCACLLMLVYGQLTQ
jgi:hypothetical protein